MDPLIFCSLGHNHSSVLCSNNKILVDIMISLSITNNSTCSRCRNTNADSSPQPFFLHRSLKLQSDIFHLPPSYKIYPNPSQIVKNNYLISHFRILNQHSSIYWKDIDLSRMKGYCLGDIVNLGKDHVQVYPIKSPKLGQELNCPCVATFFNPIDIQKCQISTQKWLKILRKKAQQLDIELVSFDTHTGQIKIRIQHFTKYSFDLANITKEQSNFQELQENYQQVLTLEHQPQQQPMRLFKPHEKSILSQQQDQFQVLLKDSFDQRERNMNRVKRIRQSDIHKNKQSKEQKKRQQDEQLPFFGGKSLEQLFKEKSVLRRSLKHKFGGTNEVNQVEKSVKKITMHPLESNQYPSFYTQKKTIIIQKPIKTTKQVQQLIDLLVRTDRQNFFVTIRAIILSENKYPQVFKQLVLLVNILFNPQNNFKLESNGEIIETENEYSVEDSLKDWFERRMQRQKIIATTKPQQLLLQGKVLELSRYYQKESRMTDAEVASKLQDRSFIRLFKVEHQNLSKQLMAVLEQVHITTLFQKESWVCKLAANVFYSDKDDYQDIIQEIIELRSENDINDLSLYRILDLYLSVNSKKRSHKFTPGTETIENSIFSWYISNIFTETEKKYMNEKEYFHVRHRLLQNLLKDITKKSTKRKIINYDNALSPEQKSKLLARYQVSKSSLNKEFDPNNLQDVLDKANTLKSRKKPLAALTTLCNFPSAIKEPSTLRELENNMYLFFHQSSPKKLKKFLRLIDPFIHKSRVVQFYKLYANILLNMVQVDIEVLVQLYSYVGEGKQSSIDNHAYTAMISAVQKNRKYFAKLFKKENVLYQQVYKYLLEKSKNNKKVGGMLKAMLLRQI